MVDIFVEGRKLDVFEGLDFSFNYSIADIREPGKRSTEYTKTIKCPATQNNDELFGHIYDVNIGNNYDSSIANVDVNFNPNKKASVDVNQDGIRIMKGSIQLRRIVKKKTEYVYEVVFVGQLVNIFSVLGDKMIGGNDINGNPYIDFSDLDHQYTMENQEASWTAPTGEGYVYPMVDWGHHLEYNSVGDRRYYVDDLKPAYYIKGLIDRIFDFAGFSYTSTFFDSAFFKRLIIPVPDLRSKEGVDSPRLFKAIKTQWQSMQQSNQYVGGFGNEDAMNHAYDVSLPDIFIAGNNKPNMVVCYDDDSASFPLSYDYGINTVFGNYSNPTTFDGYQPYDYAWHVENNTTGIYQIEATVSIVFQERYNGSLIQDEGVTELAGDLRIVRSRDGIHTEIAATSWSIPVGNSSVSVTGNDVFMQQSENVVVSSEVTTQMGDRYWIEIHSPNPESGGYNQWFWMYDPSHVTNGSAIYDIDPSTDPNDWYECKMHISDGYFKNTYLNGGLVEGEDVDMSVNAPSLKMSDLLMALVKMFNLHITPSQNKDNDLIIETYNEFYTGGTLRDWSHKLDHSKDITVSPLALLTAREFEYTYKEDGDYYNDRYQSNHGHAHGRRVVSVDNDFVQKKHTTEILFSPSPLVNDGESNRLVPKIYDSDINDGVGPTDSNVRILYYGGLFTSTPSWEHARLYGINESRSTYPYAGHLTHPTTPAQDIHFGLPLELYYTENSNTGPISITTNNLYNTFHSAHIKEITDKDSKMLTGYFRLDALDIHKLDFRDQIVIDNSLWRINKIENFNPFKEGVTKVELIKVVRRDPAESETLGMNGSGVIGGGEEYPTTTTKKMNNNYYPPFQGKVRGRSNNVSPSANNFEVNGDNNEIEGGTNNIIVRGHNNIIRGGVEDVTLINTNGVTVTRSGVTYVNNIQQNGADIVDGGEDEVRDPFSEVPVFTIDGGEGDAEQYSESAIYILDGGHG